MNVEVHQLMSNLDYGDAISNHAIEIRDILRSKGYTSHIYARYIHPKVKGECYFYTQHKKRSSGRNIAIFHHSIASEVSEYVKSLPDKKIMIYHNITPGHFFGPYNSHLTYLSTKGRNELKDFSSVPILALGDSEYNADELKGLGYPRVGVLPIIMKIRDLEKEPEKKIINKYSDSLTNIIFVGRVVPNKRFEDILKAFYFYQRFINVDSRLFLVGSYNNFENYYQALLDIAKRLQIKNVIFTGHVTQPELIAYYKLSHIFLCMSEHEGFCVPLLEAMYFGIPVLAFSSSVVPETMGGAGIVFKEKRYEEVAELINFVISDDEMRKKIIEVQGKRLLDFDREKIANQLHTYIEMVRSL